MRTPETVRVETGVHLVTGSDTNWVIVQDGDAVTLVDTGYPGDRELLLASLHAVGADPSAVAAVLVTHAHSDHIGSAEYLRTRYGIPVLAHREEVPHARRDFLQQVSVGRIAAGAWRPGVLPWAVRALRSGGKRETPVAEPREFPCDGPLDVPGRPVPVHSPGHTDGHCAYHLPDRGILITGDALVGGHPTSGLRGPQLLPRMFHHDRDRALASLSALAATGADVLLPGHGPVHRGPARAAVEHARGTAG